ncbi:hypothetical protein LXL04_016885 [Taraxacum kok-saghyz]
MEIPMIKGITHYLKKALRNTFVCPAQTARRRFLLHTQSAYVKKQTVFLLWIKCCRHLIHLFCCRGLQMWSADCRCFGFEKKNSALVFRKLYCRSVESWNQCGFRDNCVKFEGGFMPSIETLRDLCVYAPKWCMELWILISVVIPSRNENVKKNLAYFGRKPWRREIPSFVQPVAPQPPPSPTRRLLHASSLARVGPQPSLSRCLSRFCRQNKDSHRELCCLPPLPSSSPPVSILPCSIVARVLGSIAAFVSFSSRLSTYVFFTDSGGFVASPVTPLPPATMALVAADVFSGCVSKFPATSATTGHRDHGGSGVKAAFFLVLDQYCEIHNSQTERAIELKPIAKFR